jgi:hypothetical protein
VLVWITHTPAGVWYRHSCDQNIAYISDVHNLHSRMPLDPTHVHLKRTCEANMRLINGIPLGWSLLLLVALYTMFQH